MNILFKNDEKIATILLHKQARCFWRKGDQGHKGRLVYTDYVGPAFHCSTAGKQIGSKT
jgi:hypothetical protein